MLTSISKTSPVFIEVALLAHKEIIFCGDPFLRQALAAGVGFRELESLGYQIGDKAVVEEPLSAQRLKAERKLELAVYRALQEIGENVAKALKREARGQKALEDVPTNEQFWIYQATIFSKWTGGLPPDLLREGALHAERLGLAVDFDLVNTQVYDFAAGYQNEWWRQLASTTREGLRSAILANIETGLPLPNLIKDLEPLFGRKRAKMVAATEVTRLYAEGNRMGYAYAGIREVEWRTVRDSHVDPLCDELNKKRWPLGQEEFVPPRHPRCRCFLSPVTETGESLLPKDETLASPLESEKIVNVKPHGGGMNESFQGQLASGQKVFIKPEPRTLRKVRGSITPGKDIERELMASRLNWRMGNYVPIPSIVARESGALAGVGRGSERASVQEFKGFRTEGRALSDEAWRRLALFDDVIGNTDRHGNNFLFTKETVGGPWRGEWWAIDHGLAFPEGAETWMMNAHATMRMGATPGRGNPLEAPEAAVLDKLWGDRRTLYSEVKNLVGEEAAVQTLGRIALMRQRGEFLTGYDLEVGIPVTAEDLRGWGIL